jgi:hypothetical protein
MLSRAARGVVPLAWLVVVVGCGGSPQATVGVPGKADSISAGDLPIQLVQLSGGTFEQEIDHPFQPAASVGRFQQRYWYSTEFARGPDSPVLFYLCGESPCAAAYLTLLADVAKALDAAVVALEHRYYGASLPFADLTLDRMKYLTIHNALEDAAAFETFARANLPLRGKWIAVGGSYPGMLAAFYRLKHPELVVGAWASSAPVNVVLSFEGYDATVADALGPTCTLLFQQALAAADAAFDDPAKRAFLDPYVFGDDRASFLNSISYYADVAAQYGQTHRLCAALAQERLDPLTGLIGYLQPPLVTADDGGVSDGGTGPLPDAGDLAVDAGALSAPPRGVPDGRAHTAPMRLPRRPGDFNDEGAAWFYQVCTELGFYQVHNTDRSRSVSSDLIDEKYWNDACLQIASSTPDIARTRAEYTDPILRGEASNLFFVNSSEDPWSSLSILDPSRAPSGVMTFLVQGGSHCEDLDNLRPDSLLGVFQAHKLFFDQAAKWLRP